jgi:7-cyano-7-deazaguanine synthase
VSDRPLAVVLVSGGMDSCVTVAIAALTFEPALLHLTYGQRTQQRELSAFHELADHFRAAKRLVVDLSHLSVIGGSSLTDRSMDVRTTDREKLFSATEAEIPNTYVPFRNATFLSIATSWAEVLGAKRIFIGAVEEDSSGYPDCRKEFYDAYNQVIKLGTRPGSGILIETPVIGMRKAEIVRKGKELGAPFDLTWSCYQSGDEACGVCDSCALRLRAFQQAGVEDPIPYTTRPEYD